MGQDHLGDIHLLSEIAKPSLSVITLFGEAHLEFSAHEKRLPKENYRLRTAWQRSKLLIPADPIADKLLPSHVELIRFGEQADLQVTSLVESKDSLIFTVNFMDGDIFLPVTGKCHQSW